jgi:hypothetical protein
MFKNLFSKKLIVIVNTPNIGSLRDDLYGLVWHQLNDKMNSSHDPSVICHLADFIKSIDPNDEILKRFQFYKEQWSLSNCETFRFNGKKIIYV